VKLFILPPVIAALAIAIGLTGVPLAVAIIAAAMPTGANAFLLSSQVEGFGRTSASTVVITTVTSVVNLSILLLWVR
jgi:malonate transporter and related proteins